MPALNRTTSGLIFRETFNAANGWTAGTGFSRVAQNTLITWGRLPTALLNCGAVASATRTGVREGQLFQEGSTWSLLCDAGDGTNGFKQFIATHTDRGITPSVAAQSIGYSNGGGSDWLWTSTGYLAKFGAVYAMFRLVGTAVDGSPNVGLPSDPPYLSDIWTSAAINSGYSWNQNLALMTAGQWGDTDLIWGCVVPNAGTYTAFMEGRGAEFKVGYGTAPAPTGPWTMNATPIFSSADFAGPRVPENPDVFYHQQLGCWVMALNLISVDGTHTDQNAVVTSTNFPTFSSPTAVVTQRAQCLLDDPLQQVVGVARAVRGPEGAVINEAGFIPGTFDANATQGSTPGFHRGRSIYGMFWEPSANSLSYNDLTSTVHTYSKSVTNTDGVVEFQVNLGAQRSGSFIGWQYRSDGAGNGYQLIVDNSAGNNGLILQTISGTAIATSSGSITTAAGALLKIKVAWSGTNHKAWLDGELQINATNATFASGTQVAFSGKNCVAGIYVASMYASQTMTIRGLAPSATYWLRSYGALPIEQVTSDGAGVATYAAAHYPIAGIQISSDVDAKPPDLMLFGGDDLTVFNPGVRGFLQ